MLRESSIPLSVVSAALMLSLDISGVMSVAVTTGAVVTVGTVLSDGMFIRPV